MVAIFSTAPLHLQQFYLVFMSSLMAYSLTALPSLVTWILLGFLAVCDLIAVLCPFGPLRIMIEAAQEHNQEIPAAIIYTTMVSFMATPSTHSTSLKEDAVPSSFLQSENTLDREVLGDPSFDEIELLEIRPVQDDRTSNARPVDPTRTLEEETPSGLKLGLGDFIFYSVLVGRVSLSNWVTTVSCMIAVISGLIATIFILVLLKKPLPALPISIVFGAIFYYV